MVNTDSIYLKFELKKIQLLSKPCQGASRQFAIRNGRKRPASLTQFAIAFGQCHMKWK